MTHAFRVLAAGLGILTAGVLVSGCQSPTYGTGKTANQQLIDDLGSAIALETPTPAEKGIKYNPRSKLVVAADKKAGALATPQTSVADGPGWVESPEETRKRLAAEADENKNNPNYRSPLLTASSNGAAMTNDEQFAAFRKARAEQLGAGYTDRRYLTDPPTAYRSVSDPNVLNDLGEPEQDKIKRRRKAAEAAQQSGSMWWWPFQ